MTTGKQLRSLRTKKQVSQKLLAQCGSWSSAYVHKLEQSRSVSVSQVTRYAAALDAASARVTESRAKEERDSQAVLSRFEVPAPMSTPSAPPRPSKTPTPLEVDRRNQTTPPTLVPSAPGLTLNPPVPAEPKPSTQTYETVKTLLAGLGTPEVRATDISYTLPGGRGFLLVRPDGWSLRVLVRPGHPYTVTDGTDFEELVVRLRELRLLGA